jgi:N-acetylglucosaminyldiphosphoundecaprenol N-acetyl-beta-D-mannosaminyltransferase
MPLAEMLQIVTNSVRANRPTTVFYGNSYAVTLAEANPQFAAAMRKADFIFCDGFGAYLASHVLGAPIAERFTWPDWIVPLGRTTLAAGGSMFFLGAQVGVAEKAALNLEASVPGLKVHSHHGYFDKDAASTREIVDIVNSSGASVLLVGFGMPIQEIWITRHRAELKPAVVFAVGALIDYTAGNVVRGPRFLTDHGFEWLSRLIIEPRRLWRRYLIGLPEFALVVLRQKLSGRTALRAESQ